MCVIIAKKPGIEIPFEMLKSACMVNSDGWGLASVDRGVVSIQRGCDPKGNDPENIARALEQSKDIPAYLHLRFRTHGPVDLENTHPFETLNKAEHGMSVFFMHNGTMHEFSGHNSNRSDSYWFNERIVRPLLVRCSAYDDAEQVLKTPFVAEILKHYAGTANKFVLLDHFGNSMVINKSHGKEYEFGWASNEYSFRHASEDKKDKHVYYHGYRPPVKKPANDELSLGDTKLQADAEDLKRAFSDKDKTKRQELPCITLRPSFVDLAGLKKLEEVTSLSEEDILQMVVHFPEIAATLIMDLILELYNAGKSAQQPKKAITYVQAPSQLA